MSNRHRHRTIYPPKVDKSPLGTGVANRTCAISQLVIESGFLHAEDNAHAIRPRSRPRSSHSLSLLPVRAAGRRREPLERTPRDAVPGSTDPRRRRGTDARCALPRLRRGDRSHQRRAGVSPERGPAHQDRHPAHRRKSAADSRPLPLHAGERPRRIQHPRAGQRLHQHPRDRRDERRRAVHGQALRQGFRRVLRPGGQGPRRGAGPAGEDEASPIRCAGSRRTQSRPVAGQPPEPHRDADGPDHAPLRTGVLREQHRSAVRRRARSDGRVRHLAERRPEHPLLLHPRGARGTLGEGDRQQGPGVQPGLGDAGPAAARRRRGRHSRGVAESTSGSQTRMQCGSRESRPVNPGAESS